MNDFQGRWLSWRCREFIGPGIAAALARAGVPVALAGKRGDKVAATAEALKKQGATTLAIELDVTDRVAWAVRSTRFIRPYHAWLCRGPVKSELFESTAALKRSLPAGAVDPARIEASARLRDTSLYDNTSR